MPTADAPGLRINVLGESQRVLSDRFATEHPDRFGDVGWRQGTHGAPILEGCVAALECAPWRRIEAGDHMILIGRVLRCEGSGDRPLAYWRGSYRRPADRSRRPGARGRPSAAPVSGTVSQ